MNFTAITLFPALIENFLSEGLMAQAVAKNLLKVNTLNPRQFAQDSRRRVDDKAFGTGSGMVMMAEPLALAVDQLRAQGDVRVVVLSPQGRPWNQAMAQEWAEKKGHSVLVCGRYKGIDQRFVAKYADEEVSVGDYVLNGGEVAALAIIESTARLLPGFLGNADSGRHDSFSRSGLDCPPFTRPQLWRDLPVPQRLLSGDHQDIQKFIAEVGLLRTHKLRGTEVSPTVKKAAASLLRLEDRELVALGLSRTDLAHI